MKNRIVILILLMMIGTQAGAYCSEPSFYLSTPYTPSVPHCVNEWDNTHTCDEWEIESYYNDLESYSYEVGEFISALNSYVSEASEFAQCKANELE